LREILEKVGNAPMNKRLHFDGDTDYSLDTGIVFRIRHYWEIRKVVSTDYAVHRLTIEWAKVWQLHCCDAKMLSVSHL